MPFSWVAEPVRAIVHSAVETQLRIDLAAAFQLSLTGMSTFEAARGVLTQARHPAVFACYKYWLEARARSGQEFPGRQHLDPVEMADFLQYTVLTDVVREGVHCRFRHRLVGTHFTELLGREVTEQFIEHMGWLDIFDDLYRRFSIAVDDKALVYGISAAPGKDRAFMGFEHLTLPLASDGSTVDMLLGVRSALQLSEDPKNSECSSAPLVER